MDSRKETQSTIPTPAPDPKVVAASRSTFCQSLRDARGAKGLSLQQIARVTRIPERSLELLEDGQFEELPADVFVRGFLRQYAQCVGINVDDTVRRYAQCGLAPAPVSSPTAEALLESMAKLAPKHAAAVRRTKVATPPEGTEVGEQAIAPIRDPEPEVDVEASVEPAPTARPVLSAAPAPAPAAEVDAEVVPEAPVRETTTVVVAKASLESTGATPRRSANSNTKRKRKRRKKRRKPTAPIAVEAAGSPVDELDDDAAIELEAEADAREVVAAEPTELPAVEPTELPAVEPAPIEAEMAPEPVISANPAPFEGVEPGAPAGEPSPAEHVIEVVDAPGQAPVEAPPPLFASAGRLPVPTLVIDDDDPDEADRLRDARDTRDKDATWRSFLPPSLLESEDGSRRNALTLAVIILVIVATLTMSYLLRRPSNSSGDGVTQAPPTLVAPSDSQQA